MDWHPLYNSLRIAAVSSVVVTTLGIAAAWWTARLPRSVKAMIDVVSMLPMVLPPTVCGYLLLLVFGVERPVGKFLLSHGIKFVMTWHGATLAASVVAFPLMYRAARGAFESFDPDLAHAARTLGLSDAWIFWHVRMPVCRQGLIAGAVLAFARALGEYGATSMLAGYIPKRTATISTTVYHLWRTNDERGALAWALIDVAMSAVVLFAVDMLEDRQRKGRTG